MHKRNYLIFQLYAYFVFVTVTCGTKEYNRILNEIPTTILFTYAYILVHIIHSNDILMCLINSSFVHYQNKLFIAKTEKSSYIAG